MGVAGDMPGISVWEALAQIPKCWAFSYAASVSAMLWFLAELIRTGWEFRGSIRYLDPISLIHQVGLWSISCSFPETHKWIIYCSLGHLFPAQNTLLVRTCGVCKAGLVQETVQSPNDPFLMFTESPQCSDVAFPLPPPAESVSGGRHRQVARPSPRSTSWASLPAEPRCSFIAQD